jgi:hypothetical protein
MTMRVSLQRTMKMKMKRMSDVFKYLTYLLLPTYLTIC